ncbi:MAG: hypothetical protein EOO14_00545 [Chitinophagaceae bacterium]|nr:MAG: hypothetical protein EOO14_00545 [Chitinophagaceae bacterium]
MPWAVKEDKPGDKKLALVVIAEWIVLPSFKTRMPAIAVNKQDWVVANKKPRNCGAPKTIYRFYFFTGCLFPFGMGIKTGCGFRIPNKTDSTSLQFIE